MIFVTVFLGVFLGLLFVMATVPIIYYKQISEGYEDKGLFVACALAAFVVFSLFYAVVYLIIAKECYKIVSE